jgi:hypothetical protein
MARPGTLPKGISGNPGGTMRPEAITELARRYLPDVIRALVDVARLPAREFAGQKGARARPARLPRPRQARARRGPHVGQLHRLAVQMTARWLPNEHLTGDPVDEGPEIDAEA